MRGGRPSAAVSIRVAPIPRLPFGLRQAAHAMRFFTHTQTRHSQSHGPIVIAREAGTYGEAGGYLRSPSVYVIYPMSVVFGSVMSKPGRDSK